MDLKKDEGQKDLIKDVERAAIEEAVKETVEEIAKPKKKKRIWLIVLLSLLVVLLVGVAIFYWRVAVHYQTHFFPNTTINEIDCGELEASQIVLMLDNRIQDYKLEVSGRLNEEGEVGVIGEITPEDINLHYVGNADAVNRLLEQQNEWMWFETLSNKHYSHVLVQGVDFDEEMLAECVGQWDAFKNMREPQDAFISEYSEEKGYEIIPETMGTKLDEKSAIEWMSGAVMMQDTSLDLEELDCYAKPSRTAEDAKLNESVDAANKWLETSITYNWNGTEVVVDKTLLGEWISMEEEEPQLNEEAVADFVAEQAKAYDTFGKNQTITTTLGRQITLQRKSYGWKTDTEDETRKLIEAIYQGTIEEREPSYTKKGKWRGTNDIGNSYVEADMGNQHLYLYYQGVLVLETDFVSGNPNWPGCWSPEGIFGITYKTTNAVLRGENYETPVFYWMPFYGNFGMHDATWRTEFGGDIYLTDGSHGCLNLPLDKAEVIYNYMSEGFPIICYY